MNIYMIRQHLDEIERLRVKTPSVIMNLEDIAEAIEYQKSCIAAEIAELEKPLTTIAKPTNKGLFIATPDDNEYLKGVFSAG